MHNVEIPPDKVQDPWEKNVPGKGLGRDPSRTPMQWDDNQNAGFTSATPWLPVPEDYKTNNVQAAGENPESMLSLYRRLISLRRAEPALAVGSYTPLPATGDLIAYIREESNRRFLVALNLGHEPQTLDPSREDLKGRITLGTHLDRDGEDIDGSISLRSDEGLVVELT
jgi:alpha-glucosidase